MKIIGLDIGGTSIKGAVIEDGKIVFSSKVPTNAKKGIAAIINSIFRMIEILEPFAEKNSPIGIGSAGDIDPVNGKVVYATENLPNFTGLDLKKIVEDETGRETTVVNDAVAGLIGELKYGAGIGKSNAVMLTLGTGLGCGIVANEKLLLGGHYQGARLGHITLYPKGRKCTCGLQGCAEQYVSATGLMKNAVEFQVASDDATEIMKMAMENEPNAKKAVEKFLEDLTTVINIVDNIFDTDLIILGGGLVESREFWWQMLQNHLNEKTKKLVAPATLGNSAGFFGSQYVTFDKSLF